MKVSVLMPVYNGAQYLQEAIDSILNQTFKDFELIIIDDGSLDESAEIIRLNADNDSRIVPLKNRQNLGICVTLNKGLDAAKGEYIIRMDCDDISHPDRFAVQVDFMDSHPDYGMAGSKIRVFGEGIKPYIFCFDEDWRMCMADMIFSTCVAHPAVILRNNVIQKYNLRYDDRFRGVEDFYMWWQLAKFSKITNIQKPLLNYRIHKKQVTKNYKNEIYLKMLQSFLEERLFFLKVDLSKRQKEIVIRYILKDYQFNDEEMCEFIETCSKILYSIKKNNREIFSSTKLVLAEAISLCMIKSKLITKSVNFYYRMAYWNGCMPVAWYIKSRLYQILGI